MQESKEVRMLTEYPIDGLLSARAYECVCERACMRACVATRRGRTNTSTMLSAHAVTASPTFSDSLNKVLRIIKGHSYLKYLT